MPNIAGLTPKQKAAARELSRRAKLPAAVASLEASLFPEQRGFVSSPSKRVVTRAGRRGGKTRGLATIAVREAMRHPGSTIPVVERTLTCAAANELWSQLMDLDEVFKLGARFHQSLKLCTFGNGATIQLNGADTIEAADKLRGGKYPTVLLDEAGTFRDHVLRYLLDEVLGPALFDYGGSLFMAGTPGARKVGAFYEISSGVLGPDGSPRMPGWDRHHWNFRHNPYIPYDRPGEPPMTDAQRAVEREASFQDVIRQQGHSMEDPFVQREWFGEWVSDLDSLAYLLADTNWRGVRMPDDIHDLSVWTYGLGIDPGFNDPTAFVVAARNRVTARRIVLESYEQAGILPSQVPHHVEKLRTRWPFSYIIVDTGGYGKGPAEELTAAQWGLPIIAPSKRGKQLHRTFTNDGLRSGNITFVEASNRELLADLGQLRLNEKGEEDSRDANHMPDAFLYLMHYMHGYEVKPGKKKPLLIGTWQDRQEAAMEAWAEGTERRPTAHGVTRGLQGPEAEMLDSLPDW